MTYVEVNKDIEKECFEISVVIDDKALVSYISFKEVTQYGADCFAGLIKRVLRHYEEVQNSQRQEV